jgi:hypothetical protein
MDVLVRLLVGAAAAWITPDATPQQGHPSAYVERTSEDRSRLRLVR